jgi:hypothetical protein
MDSDTFVIFAELNRDKFEEILDRLMERYPSVQFGRQGDDWIWVHAGHEKVEIDSFASMQLQVKGKRSQTGFIRLMLDLLDDAWILQVFDPPKEDLTR